MLNIGHNDLKDEYLYEIKEALSLNNTLLRYGMQSTAITSDGAITLAHIIANNKALQVIMFLVNVVFNFDNDFN